MWTPCEDVFAALVAPGGGLLKGCPMDSMEPGGDGPYEPCLGLLEPNDRAVELCRGVLLAVRLSWSLIVEGQHHTMRIREG